MRGEAAKIGQRYWDARDQFAFGVQAGSIDQCIDWALAAPEVPVIISDSGDNPTAGGAGDVPIFLERLIAHNVPGRGRRLHRRRPGDRNLLCGGRRRAGRSVAGRQARPGDEPAAAGQGVVKFLLDTDDVSERQAVVQIGGMQVIVAQRRRPFHYIADFQKLGIEPSQHKIVVVKVGYLVPELKAAAAKALLALSPGAVDQAIERLPFKRITRPIYPLDKDFAWSPKA